MSKKRKNKKSRKKSNYLNSKQFPEISIKQVCKEGSEMTELDKTTKTTKIARPHLLPFSSFILFALLLVSALSIIDGAFAMGVFGVSTTFCGVYFYWFKGSAQSCISKWEAISDLAHWGIISFAVLSLVFIIFYFINNFSVKVVPKESQNL